MGLEEGGLGILALVMVEGHETGREDKDKNKTVKGHTFIDVLIGQVKRRDSMKDFDNKKENANVYGREGVFLR